MKWNAEHLRTYDAWATDKNGNPQTWEEYLIKSDAEFLEKNKKDDTSNN